MPYLDVCGVQVNFPFEPYPCQLAYMEKVVTCLQKGVNGILESPTGTGKTLCLLCASLAWLEDKKAQIMTQRRRLGAEGPEVMSEFTEMLGRNLESAVGSWDGETVSPKIIYASRTHTQLAQAIQELKRTAYRHVKVAVLGSREQLCIHPQIRKETNNTTKVHMCRAKVNARNCHFHNNLENAKGNFMNQVLDIEDLVSLGQKHNCCPYYVAKDLKSEADIIFLPYNYMLDLKSRKAHNIELNNNIVIFDEAHNLERICEDSTSFDLTSHDLASAIGDLKELGLRMVDLVGKEDTIDVPIGEGVNVGPEFTLKQVCELKAQLISLEEQIDSVPLSNPQAGITKPGSFIFELFSKINLTFETKNYVLDLLDKIVSYLAAESTSGFHSKGASLSKISDMVKIVFSQEPNEYTAISSHKHHLSKHYKVHIHQDSQFQRKKKTVDVWASNSKSEKKGHTLSYWCFSPGHAMEELRERGVKSIVLTSGTLSPMASFTTEMGIPFPVQLENPHVIERNQFWIGTVSKGPDGTLLNSSYEHRFKEEYQMSLGNTVVNFARVVPNGLLLFFPSYPVLQKCIETWQSTNIWSRIEQYKPIFVEPKGKLEFNTAMQGFYEKIQDPTLNGAIFAAVCRGKVSEGLDFSDINGRAVVITGLPFPPRMDPKVILKMQYLDEAQKIRKGLSGNEWYRQQASRAVNQAIGRVIRHKHDFGAIMLCDNRFQSPTSIGELPSWLRPYVNKCDQFGVAIKDIMKFFKTIESIMPAPDLNKKKKTPLEGSGQGAYFMPTVTRSRAGNLPVEQANMVAMHVASLQKNKESERTSMAKLKIQYEGCSSTNQSKPRGLLDALDINENKEDPNESVNESPLQKKFDKQSLMDSQKPRKRIVVKGNTASASSLQTAEKYIQALKSTLSASSYARFSASLSAYKQTEDFTAMITVMAELFTDNKRKYPLLIKFYRFVKPQHRQQFDQVCRNLTGHGCGYKPEHSVSKKRMTSEEKDTGNTFEKKRKTEDFVDTKKVKDNTAEIENRPCHLDATSHLNHGNLNTLQSASTQSISLSGESTNAKSVKIKKEGENTSIPAVTENTGISDVKNGDILCSGGGFLQTNHCEEKKSDKNDKGFSDSSTCSMRNSELAPRRVEQLDTASSSSSSQSSPWAAQAYLEKKMSGYTCSYCKEDATTPLKALCGHVCCIQCWKVCIRESKACPECGEKVKRKHLSRLFFPSGPNLTS